MRKSAPKITASDIITMLADKHYEDIFVPACKTDSSYGFGGRLFQLDAWVLRRSWVAWALDKYGVPVNKGATIGYEIKISRSDFTGDKKWRFYLDFCHRFFFVCPNGLIQPGELPREAGLLWTTKNGNRLRMVKDAPVRAIKYPVGPLLYALIVRSIKPPQSQCEHHRSFLAWYNWAFTQRHVGERVALVTSLETEIDNLNEQIDDLLCWIAPSNGRGYS